MGGRGDLEFVKGVNCVPQFVGTVRKWELGKLEPTNEARARNYKIVSFFVKIIILSVFTKK